MSVTILRRHKRGLAATSKALAQVLDSIAQIKQQRGRQAIQQAVMEASMGDGTEDERMGRVNQAIQRVRGERPQGLLEGILSAFNPNVPTFNGPTPTEDLITGAAVRDMFRSPHEDEYRQQLLESRRQTQKNQLVQQYRHFEAIADDAQEKLLAYEMQKATLPKDFDYEGLTKQLNATKDRARQQAQGVWQEIEALGGGVQIGTGEPAPGQVILPAQNREVVELAAGEKPSVWPKVWEGTKNLATTVGNTMPTQFPGVATPMAARTRPMPIETPTGPAPEGTRIEQLPGGGEVYKAPASPKPSLRKRPKTTDEFEDTIRQLNASDPVAVPKYYNKWKRIFPQMKYK